MRHEPPLDYVGEKLHHALDAQQRLLREMDARAVSERASGSTVAGEAALKPPLDTTTQSAIAAFHYLVTAYLALHNMLGSHTGHDYLHRLWSMSGEDFDRWLAFVEREGSVSGGGG